MTTDHHSNIAPEPPVLGRFMMIPIPALKELFVHREPHEGLDIVINIGIFHTSTHINTDWENVLRQTFYCFYHKPKDLTKSIWQKLNNLKTEEVIECDLDHRGFDTEGNFDAIYEADSLSEYCNKDPKFKRELEEWHRIRYTTDKIMNINADGTDFDAISNSYKEANSKYKFADNCIFARVNPDIVMRFYTNETASLYQNALFAMYIGICSIVGRKAYTNTVSSLIKARMFGARNWSELQKTLMDNSLKEAYAQFTTRHHYDKLIKELQSMQLISEIGRYRRTFLSTSMTAQELEKETNLERANKTRKRSSST